jgi:hypothetical protein
MNEKLIEDAIDRRDSIKDTMKKTDKKKEKVDIL